MQNTIVKRYASNPGVVTVVLDQGGRNGEDLDRFLLYWSSYLLRGPALFDSGGRVGQDIFGQPRTGLPFGRGFIIGPDGTVALPYFGYDPATITGAIDALLRRPRHPAGRAGTPSERGVAQAAAVIGARPGA